MAENTLEGNTTKSEDEMSLASEVSSEDNKAVSIDKKENHEQIDVDKPSTSKGTSDVTVGKEKIEDTNLLTPEKQHDPPKTDCNGDLNDETNRDQTETTETRKPETVEAVGADTVGADVGNEIIEVSLEDIEEDNSKGSSLEKSSDDEIIYSSTIHSNLNDILQIVHGDLAMNIIEAERAATTNLMENKEEEKKENEERQQTVKKEVDTSTDDTASNTSMTDSTDDKKDSTESLESSDNADNTEKKSNFEIVRSPTTIDKVVEEQLVNNLSTDRTDSTIECVKNSEKINVNEESNIEKYDTRNEAEDTKEAEAMMNETENMTNETENTMNEAENTINEAENTTNEAENTTNEAKNTTNEARHTTNEAEKRKRLSITPPFVSPRKSQKLVSNIIKKSIKW